MDGIFGLAALGFWLFVAAAAVGGIWDGVRKRDAEHETLRRLIESGREPDQELVDKLLGNTKKPARDLTVAGLIVIFAAPGLALMGWVLSLQGKEVLMPLLGVAGLVAFVGVGLLTAARFLKRDAQQDSPDNKQLFR
jgi:hypothetical protein